MRVNAHTPAGGAPTVSVTAPRDRAAFCFTPSYAPPGAMQEIRVVVAGQPGFLSTDIAALTVDAAEALCGRLNAQLGLTEEECLSIVYGSMPLEPAGPRPGCH